MKDTHDVSVDMTSDGARPKEPTAIVRFWLNEIAAAKEREKDFRKDGIRILGIYNGERSGERDNIMPAAPFNILYSNTETFLPAVYSQVPRPVVERRFKDNDPTGKAAAEAGRRMLEFLLDTNVEGYETFDEAMSAAALDAALPGRGVTAVKFDAKFAQEPADGEDQELPDGTTEEQADEYAEWELVCTESKVWNRVYHAFAKKWSKVGWVAYEEFLDKEECTKKFGAAIAGKLTYTDEQRDQDKDEPKTEENHNKGERKTVCVYQIWDKDGGKKLRYISENYKEGYLLTQDDPLGLTGFYNCPKPLMFFRKAHNLIPTALYVIYENQAKELNKIQRRINHVVDAIKARGVYDSAYGSELANVFKVDDAALIPSDQTAGLAKEGGLKNAIWFIPLEALIATLQQLYTARESCKQVIYEITGLSDIIRGASKASETLGAQEIKNQWGTLRLKRMQKEVQRYARDLMRMMLEIAASKFSEETWAKMTGLPFVTTEQRQQDMLVMQAAQQSQQPMQDPAIQQRMAAPVWGEVIGVLKDDMQRAYRIDIETNSTVEPEAAEDQKAMTEMMTALGQAMNSLAPLVAKGVMPFEVAQSILLAIAKRFRFGSEIEDILKQMKPPQPEGDNGQAEIQKAQAQMQQMQAQMQQKEQAMQQQVKQIEGEKSLLEKKVELDLREIKLNAQEAELQMREQVATERQTLREDKFKTTVSATDKVRSANEKVAKQGEQVAQQADSKVAQGIQVLQDTMQEFIKMQGEFLKAITQAIENDKHLETVVKAITAPRKVTRGKDGKVEGTEVAT